MLQIKQPATEFWDEQREQFVTLHQEYTLKLEHSLVSISKWESKWHKSFFSNKAKTEEEATDYIRCMTVSPSDVPFEVYQYLSQENIQKINDYIADPMTATTITDERPGGKGRSGRDIVTSELIYYWMIALTIPIKCEHWHINRLLTLIQVCNIKNSPGKKRSARDIARRNEAINEARKAKLNTRG